MQTALYIHIPWCIKKCPYCDFNSHKSPDILPERAYIDALTEDLAHDLTYLPKREISSIFIGGGTPSLFSAESFAKLFENIQTLLPFANNLEITLEANPGTVEQQRFCDYKSAGINRLSLGIQSFHPEYLRRIGRIHDDKQARLAVETARFAGFDNINLDIMHSLPKQSMEDGLADLAEAIAFEPEHISWYQLTLEPNTVFYKQRPILPDDEVSAAIEEKGFALLAQNGYHRYEISAFCRDERAAKHNLNYWLFGDYYGIGAGAHSKITDDDGKIIRTQKQRQPKDYLHPDKKFVSQQQYIDADTILFEFMLNTTRLEQPIPLSLFQQQTGLRISLLQPKLQEAQAKGLLIINGDSWHVTPLGRRFTNDLQALFL